MKDKYILYILLFVIVLFVGIPRIMSVNSGLPYNQFWDEPLVTEGALNGLKRAFDNNNSTNILPVSSEVVYGEFLRYTMMLEDAIYYLYLLATDPDVHSLSDIKTSINGEQALTVSHPGFYYWNRVYHAALSILSIVIMFLLLKKLYNIWYGLLGVILLGTNFYYFSQSYIVVANVPLAAMVIIAIYFAVLYNHTKEYKYLLWSLVFSGISMATKMTGAATILVPFVAVLFNYNSLKEDSLSNTLKKGILLALTPIGVFLIFSPSVYFNTSHFLYWMKWLSNIYKDGGDNATITPGIQHFIYQLKYFYNNIGIVFSSLSVIGITAGLLGIGDIRGKRKEFLRADTLILFLFAVLYLLYVTFQYTISYHRNFVFIYPILSIFAVSGISFVLNSVLLLSPRLKKVKNALVFFVAVLLLYMYLPNIKNIYSNAIFNHNSKDTRSLIIENFKNKTTEPFHLGIENGLKMSLYDLKPIQFKYSFFDISNIDSAMLGFTHLLVPDYNFINKNDTAFSAPRIRKIDELIKKSKVFGIKGSTIDYYHHLAPWTPIVNPNVSIIKGSNFPPPLLSEFLSPICNYPLIEIINSNVQRLFLGVLDEGWYKINFFISGTEVKGEYATIELKVANILTDTIAAKSSGYYLYSTRFQINKKRETSIEVRLINDYYNPDKGEDINAYVKSFTLVKEPINNKHE